MCHWIGLGHDCVILLFFFLLFHFSSGCDFSYCSEIDAFSEYLKINSSLTSLNLKLMPSLIYVFLCFIWLCGVILVIQKCVHWKRDWKQIHISNHWTWMFLTSFLILSCFINLWVMKLMILGHLHWQKCSR